VSRTALRVLLAIQDCAVSNVVDVDFSVLLKHGEDTVQTTVQSGTPEDASYVVSKSLPVILQYLTDKSTDINVKSDIVRLLRIVLPHHPRYCHSAST
jgi:hypothetical protein